MLQTVEDVKVFGSETLGRVVSQQTAMDSISSGEVVIVVVIDDTESAAGEVEARGTIDDQRPPESEVAVFGAVSPVTITSDLTWGELKLLPRLSPQADQPEMETQG